MDSVSIVTAVVAACSPIILGVFTWLTRRGLETRAAEETTLDKRLEQQRNDFNSVIVPMQETVKRLQSNNDALTKRVDDMDVRLDVAEGDKRELVYDFRRTLDHLEREYKDTGPRRGSRVNELLGY